MNLKEQQAQRMELRTKAEEAIREIRENTDEARTAELEKRHDDIMDEFHKLDERIEREQRHAALLARFEDRAEAEERARREGRRPAASGEASCADDGDGDDKADYRGAFIDYIVAGGNVALLSNEARAVLKGGYQNLREMGTEARALVTSSNSAGGYTVPPEMVAKLIERMAKMGPMLDGNWVTVLPTATGRSMTMPTIDETGGASQVATHTQGSGLTDDGGVDPVFGQFALEAYGLNTEWVQISAELGEDSALALEAILIRVLGTRLARKGNAWLTTGSGSSQPKGIVTATSAGATAAATAAIVTTDLFSLRDSVDEAYWDSPNTGWMAKRSTLTAIEKLQDANDNFIWRAGDIQRGVPSTILGFPYRTNPDMASLAASAKVMTFGDMSSYYTRTVGQPLIAAIQDTTNFPNVGVAGFWRIDGDLSDTAAVKHLAMAAS